LRGERKRELRLKRRRGNYYVVLLERGGYSHTPLRPDVLKGGFEPAGKKKREGGAMFSIPEGSSVMGFSRSFFCLLARVSKKAERKRNLSSSRCCLWF